MLDFLLLLPLKPSYELLLALSSVMSDDLPRQVRQQDTATIGSTVSRIIHVMAGIQIVTPCYGLPQEARETLCLPMRILIGQTKVWVQRLANNTSATLDRVCPHPPSA